MNKTTWLSGETYYQRLERLGWKHQYRAARWDMYIKGQWACYVPPTTKVQPWFVRNMPIPTIQHWEPESISKNKLPSTSY